MPATPDVIDWDGIRLFMKIVESGSLSSAGQVVGLSQPTISRRLRQLEESLGGKLFNRLPNHLELTKLGHETVAFGQAMNAAAGELRRRADSLRLDAPEPVRVSASMSISLLLAEAIGELLGAAAPFRAEIQIHSSRITANMSFREADIALRHRRPPETGPVRSRKVGSIGFALYGPAGQPGVKTIVGLINDRPPPQPSWVDSHAAENGFVTICRLGEFYLRQAAIRAGSGVSLLPCFVGDSDPTLCRTSEPVEELREDIYMLIHEQAAKRPVIAAVAERILEVFSRQKHRLSGARGPQNYTTHPPA